MDENHQERVESKLIVTEDKLWLPPLPPKDQKRLKRLQKKSLTERIGFAGKTPWDLIQLLLIPLVLAGIGFWFNAQQNQTSLQVSERQHQADLQVAATRYANDQQLAADQQREITLKTCRDDIKDLLLNKGLRVSKPRDEVSIVARAEVLSALRQLDGERKGILIQFLSEAGLITSSSGLLADVIIDLRGADLRGADLRGADLFNADLNGAYLNGANLSYANLNDANLNAANLEGANLYGTYLIDVHLFGTNLRYVDLTDADLRYMDLRGVDLRDDYLDGAHLNGAHLNGAHLNGAYLNGADFSGADLSRAIVTNVQLAEAKSLKGAIMPDGSTHL